MKVPRLSLVAIVLFTSVTAASAQASDGRVARAILVDVIGGRSAVRPAVPTPRGVSTSVGELERRAFELANAERQAIGLRSLEWDDTLAELARLHSRNMAEYSFFSHRGLEGEMIDDRANRLGLRRWTGIGENIAYLNGYDDPTAVAVQKWMQSQAHKKNILNAVWQESAIGVAVARDGKVYFTQVFLLR